MRSKPSEIFERDAEGNTKADYKRWEKIAQRGMKAADLYVKSDIVGQILGNNKKIKKVLTWPQIWKLAHTIVKGLNL